MTEYENKIYDIDCKREKYINRLDRQFLNSDMAQEEYDRLMRIIDEWAEGQYNAIEEDAEITADAESDWKWINNHAG